MPVVAEFLPKQSRRMSETATTQAALLQLTDGRQGVVHKRPHVSLLSNSRENADNQSSIFDQFSL
jgi:hypothetical protein